MVKYYDVSLPFILKIFHLPLKMIIFTYKDKKKKLQIYLRTAFENNFLFFKIENIENTFDNQILKN